MSDLLSPVSWARWEHYEGTPGRYVTRKWTCRVESSAMQGNSLASQGGPHAAVPRRPVGRGNRPSGRKLPRYTMFREAGQGPVAPGDDRPSGSGRHDKSLEISERAGQRWLSGL